MAGRGRGDVGIVRCDAVLSPAICNTLAWRHVKQKARVASTSYRRKERSKLRVKAFDVIVNAELPTGLSNDEDSQGFAPWSSPKAHIPSAYTALILCTSPTAHHER